jgi:hypothetical protein
VPQPTVPPHTPSLETAGNLTLIFVFVLPMAYTELFRLSSLAVIPTDNLPFALLSGSVFLERRRDVTVPLNLHAANLRRP